MIRNGCLYRRTSTERLEFRVLSFSKASLEEIEAFVSTSPCPRDAFWIFREQLEGVIALLHRHHYFMTDKIKIADGDFRVFLKDPSSVEGMAYFWVFDYRCRYCQEDTFSLSQILPNVYMQSMAEVVPLCEYHTNVWLLQDEMRGGSSLETLI